MPPTVKTSWFKPAKKDYGFHKQLRIFRISSCGKSVLKIIWISLITLNGLVKEKTTHMLLPRGLMGEG